MASRTCGMLTMEMCVPPSYCPNARMRECLCPKNSSQNTRGVTMPSRNVGATGVDGARAPSYLTDSSNGRGRLTETGQR